MSVHMKLFVVMTRHHDRDIGATSSYHHHPEEMTLRTQKQFRIHQRMVVLCCDVTPKLKHTDLAVQ